MSAVGIKELKNRLSQYLRRTKRGWDGRRYDSHEPHGQSDRSSTRGDLLTFTATAASGTAPHQFKWWYWDGSF